MEGKVMRKIWERCALRRDIAKEFLAEFLGLFVLVVFGCGAMAQMTLARRIAGDLMTVHVGFSVGLTMAVYVSGGVSGGHVNPAVSLAMVLLDRLPLKKFPVYVLAQFLGAFVGSCVVFALYHDALMSHGGGQLTIWGVNATAHIFASYPARHLSAGNGFLDQVVATGMLTLCILAVTDGDNMGAPRGMQPVSIGLIILGIGSTMGLNCGYPINPARDFGPRVFTALAGWGKGVFRFGGYWWWIPVVAPMVGGAVGAATYLFLIGLHHSELHRRRVAPHRVAPQQVREDLSNQKSTDMSRLTLPCCAGV